MESVRSVKRKKKMENEIRELQKRVEHAEDVAKRSFKLVIWSGILLLLVMMGFGWMLVNNVIALKVLTENEKVQEQFLDGVDTRLKALEKH